MQRESRKYLYDMLQAASSLAVFTAGKTFDDYEADTLLRSAVERQFEILGEALSQPARIDWSTAEQIPDYRRVIAFRNILIHGYSEIDNRIVWGVLTSDLSPLTSTVEALLDDGS